MSAHASRSRLFRALFTGALVSALTSALIGLPTAARAATRPDLTVSALTLATRHLVRGGALRVTETTHDAGATAPSTWTRYWLSRDRTHSTSDRLLGSRAVPKLRPARHSSFAKSWTIPASTGTGTWYVVACADASHKVRESHESNNCRASASLTVTAPAPPVVVDTTFPISPNPSKVTPSFGTGTVTTGIANAFADDPNSFTVTGPDGTTYTLDIPAQAFNRGLALKVTPLTGLTGAPLSGLVAGVRLEPTGMRLLRNATLTITPHSSFSWTNLTGLRFFDDGADAAMFPLDQTHSPSGAVRLSINELATYAVGTATAANRTTALAHPPVRTDGQYYNLVAGSPPAPATEAAGPTPAATSRTLASSTVTDPSPVLAASDAALPSGQSVDDDYYDHVLKPALEAAKTDDSTAPQAVGDTLAWAHDQAVLGNSDSDRVIDAFVEMLAVLHTAVAHEYTRCTADHSLADLGLLLANARTFLVLGATADGEAAYENARSCGRFQVTFVDHLEYHQHYPAGVTGDTGFDADEVWEVHTTAPILMSLSPTGNFTGTGTLDYSQFDYESVNTLLGSSCTLTTTTAGTGTHPGATDGTKATLGVDLLTNPVAPGPGTPTPHPADTSLNLNFGLFAAQPSEDYTTTNSGCSSSSSSLTDQKWALTSKHFKTSIAIPRNTQAGPTITTYNDSFDNGAAGDLHGGHQTEATTVVVTHVPQ